MGQLVGIPSGNAVAQQQLQNMNLIKIVQAVTAESMLDPLSVTVMYRHIFTSTLVYSCIFLFGALE
jgi:hypothetical protein